MKKWKQFGVVLALACSFGASAQNQQYAFLVQFGDKNATTLSLDAPSAFLSPRALERRIRYNIAVDSTDLPVVASYTASVLQLTNGKLHVTSRWQNSIVVLIADSASILSLNALPFVTGFKKVAYYPSGLHFVLPPPDTAATGGKPTGFDASYYQNAWTQIHLCQGEYLHNKGYRGSGKLIAVIDVGFSGADTIRAFDSLRQQNRIVDTRNFVLDTSFVFGYNQHGTQVLSCMASVVPGTHVGTAPDAAYALYLTDDAATEQIIEESNFLAAAERADSLGADVITTSLGYNTFDNPADDHSYSDLDGNTTIAARAANAAVRKGVFVLASAGNEGQTSWQHILTPGDADSVMTVGAVNSARQHAAFSGSGPNAANVLKPDVCGMGVQASVYGSNGNVVTSNGTSFSTPIIAGLSACLMQAVPNLQPLEIRALIDSYCDSFSTPSYTRGYGVPDFMKSLDHVTAINDIPTKPAAALSVYPNPSRGTFRLLGKGYLYYDLMDTGGRLLKSGKAIAGQEIDITDMAAGLYLLRVRNDRQIQTFKVQLN